MRSKSSIIVIGGGIIGLLAAWYLRKQGQEVVIIERQTLGREASWAGAGVLSPLYPARYPVIRFLVQESLAEYRRIVPELYRRTGQDAELLPSPLLVLDRDVPAEGECRRISRADIASQEPALRVPCDVAIQYPCAQVRNSRLLPALRTALIQDGVYIVENCEAHRFETTNERLVGVHTTAGFFETRRCVVAAGAWTGGLLATSGFALPIKPIKGQIIVFKQSPGLLRSIVVFNYRYLLQRSDGHLLVGSTVEDSGFNKVTTLAASEELRQAAIELLPDLGNAPIVHHWAGLRPGSPDDAPFIGQHPGIAGLFVCAGHYRNGFATAPASARMVVDLALERVVGEEVHSFRLDRDCGRWPGS